MNVKAWHISVLIPARDEEVLLPECLHSLVCARALLPFSATCSVIVAVDSSSDNTFRLARLMLSEQDQVVRTDVGNVGAARSLAAVRALERHHGEAERHWLANTDADCTVPATWLKDQLAIAERGLDAVAGIVDVQDFSAHGPGVEKRFRETYTLHPDSTHPHVHGANLGVRADVYLRSGGWPHVSTGEDHGLWQRLQQVRAKTLATTHLKVITSGRRVGRAPQGFAAALAAHNEQAA